MKPKQCKRCGRLRHDGHRCEYVIGELVRLPDGRTANVVNIRRHVRGDVVVVQLPGGKFRDYLAEELRWVTHSDTKRRGLQR